MDWDNQKALIVKIGSLLNGIPANTVKEILEELLKCVDENSIYTPKESLKEE
jgi:hypothetical protein